MELRIKNLYERLFPICRSITGDGVRDSLKILSEVIPYNIIEVKSGKKVFDWEVPKEWRIHDAWIKDGKGNKIVDFKVCNLHVVSYSTPIHKKVDLNELKEHLFYHPTISDAIPYVTSYYSENWGFCISKEMLLNLNADVYEVYIDSSLHAGSLTLADFYIPATINTKKEILITSYLCHPSMANNELSGPIVLTLLAEWIKSLEFRQYNFRFVISPETIGAISYLNIFGKDLKENVFCGFVVTCCGDSAQFTLKKAINNFSRVNEIVEHELLLQYPSANIKEFFPYGSDERQYSSPAYKFEMVSLMRSMYGEYPEYHTSKDDLSFVSASSTLETIEAYKNLILSINYNLKYISNFQNGEPMLGKRGVYSNVGIGENSEFKIRMMWILSCGDGEHSLLDVALKANCSIIEVYKIYSKLNELGVVSKL